MGAIQMCIGACTSGLVSALQNHTALPMTGVMAVCAIAAFIVLSLGRKIILQRASITEVKEEDVEMISTL
jgi:DHA1 family bicyclomycin/chloramphenicol resistance-like MFS transporter